MIVYNDNREFQRIECDGCGQRSPPTQDIFINRGLNNMGWQCLGGTHKCPTCKPAESDALAAE